MPEILLRYHGEHNQQRALMMAAAAQERAKSLFGKNVAFEIQPFGPEDGFADFTLNLWVTDNDDALIDLCARVHRELLDLMVQLTFLDERVECWVQRVKGVWEGKRGAMQRIAGSLRSI